MKNIKKLLGKRIKELRCSLSLSQQDLSEKINIDQRNLSNIECGVSFPTRSIVQIAEVLHVSMKDLFDFDHLKKTQEEMKTYINKEIEIIKPDKVTLIYKFIKSLR